MQLIKASYQILTPVEQILQFLPMIEAAGRTCYKSEDRIGPDTAEPFVKKLVCDFKHESVIEHCSLSVRFIVDRGVSHELVRHRIASFSQESTRYCNYGKRGVAFIIPPWVGVVPGTYHPQGIHSIYTPGDLLWFNACLEAACRYELLLNQGWSPQQARSVLTNSLKTEVVMTANLREWRHVLELRTSRAAHPQMREVMYPILRELQGMLPAVFGDIIPHTE